MSKPNEGMNEDHLCDSISYQEALKDSMAGHPTVRRWASAMVNAFCEIDRLNAVLDAKQKELDACLVRLGENDVEIMALRQRVHSLEAALRCERSWHHGKILEVHTEGPDGSDCPNENCKRITAALAGNAPEGA